MEREIQDTKRKWWHHVLAWMPLTFGLFLGCIAVLKDVELSLSGKVVFWVGVGILIRFYYFKKI